MARLSPQYASVLADDIYTIRGKRTRQVFLDQYGSDFDMEDEQQLKGKTGAFVFLKSEHTMGVAAVGKSSAYKGQAIVALKGTASGFDALTDMNAGLKRFHTGEFVHQGFYYTFLSFLPQLKEFLPKLTDGNVHTIHCVGHSLGGALATLVADWLKSNTSCDLKLYTFGSPRVGLGAFADKCCSKLDVRSVHRVYHTADPVPMVPTWPFSHVPESGTGEFGLSMGTSLNPGAYHKMGNYRASVLNGNNQSLGWDELAAKKPPTMLSSSVESWLKSDGPISLTLNTAKVLGSALLWVVEKVVKLTGIVLVSAFSTTFTILDRLAYLMHKAFEFGKDAAFWTVRLIKRMARLVGITIVDTANITYALIRAIFLRVHHAISQLVMQASQVIL